MDVEEYKILIKQIISTLNKKDIAFLQMVYGMLKRYSEKRGRD